MTKLKWIEGLDCETAARAGISFVLRAKLDEMCRLREAALDFTDIEGVHKMRVASRRLRSALRDFQPYLSKPVSPERLKAVARALGAVRDEDVALAMIDELLAEADADARAGIELLADERRARREKARARLVAAISVGALGELREKFAVQVSRAAAESRATTLAATAAEATTANDVTTAAEATTADATAGEATAAEATTAEATIAEPSAAEDASDGARRVARGMRFAEVGGEIVRARFRELKRSARSLYRPFEVEPLHEMRIRAKRLRYAIEIFTQCWGETVAPYASEIAKMQEYLGELHDCDVWIDDLSRRLGRRGRGAAHRQDRAAERRAAFWLLNHFTKARAKHYAKALALWDRWETTGFESSLAASVAEARAAMESPAREPVAEARAAVPSPSREPVANEAAGADDAAVVSNEGAAVVSTGDAQVTVDEDKAEAVETVEAEVVDDPRTLQA